MTKKKTTKKSPEPEIPPSVSSSLSYPDWDDYTGKIRPISDTDYDLEKPVELVQFRFKIFKTFLSLTLTVGKE